MAHNDIIALWPESPGCPARNPRLLDPMGHFNSEILLLLTRRQSLDKIPDTDVVVVGCLLCNCLSP